MAVMCLPSVMNQREFTRVRTAIPVDIILPSQTLAGTTRDVSLSGCHVVGVAAPTEETHCTVVLHIDGRGGQIQVTAKGVVARILREGFALHFFELVEIESYEHLRNLVLYNAEDPTKAESEFDTHLGLKRMDLTQPPPG